MRSPVAVITLETLLWPDEVRTPDFAFLDEEVEVRSQELKLAASLIDMMTEDFDPGQQQQLSPPTFPDAQAAAAAGNGLSSARRVSRRAPATAYIIRICIGTPIVTITAGTGPPTGAGGRRWPRACACSA